MKHLQTADGRFVQVGIDAWWDTSTSNFRLVSNREVEEHAWEKRIPFDVSENNGPKRRRRHG